MSQKQPPEVFLEISQNSQENTRARVTWVTEHLRTTASDKLNFNQITEFHHVQKTLQ